MVYNAEQLEAAASGFAEQHRKNRAAPSGRTPRRNVALTPRLQRGDAERSAGRSSSPPRGTLASAVEGVIKTHCGAGPRAFVLNYVDDAGQLQTCVSDSLDPLRERICESDFVSKSEILKAVKTIPIASHSPDSREEDVAYEDSRASQVRAQVGPTRAPQPRQTSSRNVRTVQPAPPPKRGRVTFPNPAKALKRPKYTSGSDTEEDDATEALAYAGTDDEYGDDDRRHPEEAPTIIPQTKSLRIGDEESVRKFFYGAFSAIQQLALKWILKQWIKAIEPKKQANFPYVLGNPDKMRERRRRQMQANKGPATEEPGLPKWWPEGVQYKEPDHIKKEERLCLAWNIVSKSDPDKAYKLMDGKVKRHAWTELLQSSTLERIKLKTDKENADHRLEAREKFDRRNRILDEVYKMAGNLEDYVNGNIDPTEVFSYVDEFSLSAPSKANQISRRSSVQKSPVEDASGYSTAQKSPGSRKTKSHRRTTKDVDDHEPRRHPRERDQSLQRPDSRPQSVQLHSEHDSTSNFSNLTSFEMAERQNSSISLVRQQGSTFIGHEATRSLLETPSCVTSFSSMPSETYFEPPIAHQSLPIQPAIIQDRVMEWSQSQESNFDHPVHQTMPAPRFEQPQPPMFRPVGWENSEILRAGTLQSSGVSEQDRWQSVYADTAFNPPGGSSVMSMMAYPHGSNAPILSSQESWAQPSSNYVQMGLEVTLADHRPAALTAPPSAGFQADAFYTDEWSRSHNISLPHHSMGSSAKHESSNSPMN